jgi:uncharacterized protein YxeA
MKTILLTLLTVVLFTASAFAAYTDVATGDDLGTTTTPAWVAKGSKGVQVDYIGAGTAGAGGQGYVLGAYHLSGTQTFATSSGDTKIFRQENTGVAIPTTAPTGSDTADFSAWTAM